MSNSIVSTEHSSAFFSCSTIYYSFVLVRMEGRKESSSLVPLLILFICNGELFYLHLWFRIVLQDEDKRCIVRRPSRTIGDDFEMISFPRSKELSTWMRIPFSYQRDPLSLSLLNWCRKDEGNRRTRFYIPSTHPRLLHRYKRLRLNPPTIAPVTRHSVVVLVSSGWKTVFPGTDEFKDNSRHSAFWINSSGQADHSSQRPAMPCRERRGWGECKSSDCNSVCKNRVFVICRRS